MDRSGERRPLEPPDSEESLQIRAGANDLDMLTRKVRIVPKTFPANEQFVELAASFSAKPGVTVGSGKRGFGASALHINGKIFAMVSSKGNFVVKLPKNRVDALAASGIGAPFSPGPGRIMREWLEVGAGSDMPWTDLATEAYAFGSGRT